MGKTGVKKARPQLMQFDLTAARYFVPAITALPLAGLDQGVGGDMQLFMQAPDHGQGQAPIAVHDLPKPAALGPQDALQILLGCPLGLQGMSASARS